MAVASSAFFSEPSRFSASRPSSKTARNGEEYKVHEVNHREGTKGVTHKLLDRLRSNKHSNRQTHMAVTIPRDTMMDNGEGMDVNANVDSNPDKMNHQQSNGVDLNYAMIDGGSNCSIANENMQLLDYEYPERLVNISGIVRAAMNNMRIGSFTTVTSTQDGEQILLIFHEYAHLAEDHVVRSIHSALHIQDGGSIVNDTTTHLGGKQTITTPSNHVIPSSLQQRYPLHDN